MKFIINRLQYIILLVFGIFILPVFSQPANVILTDTTFSTTDLIQAANSISAGPNVTITGSGNLTLEAPSIILTNTVFTLGGGQLLLVSNNPAVGIKNEKHITPDEYILDQNYPNPFNPATSINYYVPKESHISLVVYDVLGKEVKVLVNGEETAGYHRIEFDASELPSGIYFYRLQAGTFMAVKKMILLK
jgi:hypothetical protein